MVVGDEITPASRPPTTCSPVIAQATEICALLSFSTRIVCADCIIELLATVPRGPPAITSKVFATIFKVPPNNQKPRIKQKLWSHLYLTPTKRFFGTTSQSLRKFSRWRFVTELLNVSKDG